jgi:hypothetical protein
LQPDDIFGYQEYIRSMQERLKDLQPTLDSFTESPHHSDSLTWWHNLRQYHLLPFSGAWMDQPAWWLEDVRYFDLLEEQSNLPHWIARAEKALSDAMRTIRNGTR